VFSKETHPATATATATATARIMSLSASVHFHQCYIVYGPLPTISSLDAAARSRPAQESAS
jgi:hypothetical protein